MTELNSYFKGNTFRSSSYFYEIDKLMSMMMSLRCLALAVVCCWAAAVNAGHGKIVAVPQGSEVPDGAGVHSCVW